MRDFSGVSAEDERAKEFARLQPGEKVAVELVSVEGTDDGHLDFRFNGTSPMNPGNFKPRFWNGDFDEKDDRYIGDERAEERFKQLKHIISAYLSEAEWNNTYKAGMSWDEFRKSILANLTPDKYKGVATQMKVVYKYNSDEEVALPKWPNFISTTKAPRPLKLRTGEKDGIPYERIKPLSEYGVNAPKAEQEDDLPFGKMESTPSFK